MIFLQKTSIDKNAPSGPLDPINLFRGQVEFVDMLKAITVVPPIKADRNYVPYWKILSIVHRKNHRPFRNRLELE
jgi:hypothetical protein